MKIIKVLSVAACIALICSCASTRNTHSVAAMQESKGIEMSVYPERNGGAPQSLELTVRNNTGQLVQFGANYSIERLADGEWVNHELGNFAVIAIMYTLQPGDSGKYTISLFSDRVAYPEGDYRVVKRINVGEGDARPYYAGFKIIVPR